MKFRVIVLALFAILLFAPSYVPQVRAITINVNSGMTTAAINAAIAGATWGDVVQFAPGTYGTTAPLVAGAPGVYLVGDPADPSNVVIDASGMASIDGDGFQVQANAVTITGFTINHVLSRNPAAGNGYMNAGIMIGNDAGNRRMDAGGEINVVSGTFSHNVIFNATVGIYAYRSSNLTITDNAISYSNLADSSVSIAGMGIVLCNEPPQNAYVMSANKVERNTLLHNYGAGIAVIYNDTAHESARSSFYGTVISNNNMTDNWYAGLYIQQAVGPIIINDNTATNNVFDPFLGSGGDGLHILSAFNVYAHQNLLSDNTNYNVLIGSHVEHMEFTGNTVGAAGTGYGFMMVDEWGTALYLPAVMTIHGNNFAADPNGVIGIRDYSGTLDLTNNWWGDVAGPNVATGNPPVTYLGPGAVGKLAIWTGVAFDSSPWLASSAPQEVDSSTGAGQATFSANKGALNSLAAINPLPPNPPVGVNFPYGIFSFDVANLLPGATVTVTAQFPASLPSGTGYWKYQFGAWVSIPASIAGNVLTIHLTDGGTGDSDLAANGRITDPGGPGTPNLITFYTSPSTVGSITVAGHGTYTNGESAFLPNGNYTVTANPTGYYAFTSWASFNVTTSPTTTQSATLNVTSNGNVTAIFHSVPPTTYLLTLNTNPPGLDTPTGGGAYALGAVAHINVANVANYTFQKWLKDGADYSTFHAFNYTVDAAHTFTAVFIAIPSHYAVVVNTSPSGLDSPTGGGTYTSGATATISVGSATGYTFKQWNRDGVNYTSSMTFGYAVDANHTFTAVFQANPPTQYAITVNTSPSGLDSPTGAGTHLAGVVITISVGNATGYTFQKWLKDGADYSTQRSFNYTVEANRSFTAVFQSAPATPHCIIATAAYGSPMAPEVVYMRHVRDGMIGSTPTGRVLRDWWNWFYYLWSPPIAQAIGASPTLQAVFRVLLIPLVSTVHMAAGVFTVLGGGNLASVLAFAVAAAFSVVSYLVLPVCVVRTAWMRRKWLIRRLQPASIN